MKNIYLKLGEWFFCIVLAIFITFLLKTFIFNITEVSGASMNNTIKDKDKVAFEKISKLTKNFNRGDIIVFDPIDANDMPYIKRVVGIPGDSVKIENGNVYINEKPLKESYLSPYTITESNINLTLDSNHVFVLGDNRTISKDSRVIGPVPIDNIKGSVIFRVYPFNSIGFIN